MTQVPLRGVLRQLRYRAGAAPDEPTPDPELLQRFVARRDEAAFEELVRRHGPMVLGLCRRLLRQPQDAEDAFQAVFLVLARRVASIRKQDALASWLHGVALRVAHRARTAAERRRAVELRVAPATLTVPLDAMSWGELRLVLDDELARLPER